MSNYFLFGLAGTGKDTAADILQNEFGIYTLALADAIRSDYEKYFGRKDHKQNRSKMIEIGETYKTIYGQDVWCKAALNKIVMRETLKSSLAGHTSSALIKDGRYPFEYDYFVRIHGFIPIRIVADLQTRLDRLSVRDGSTQELSLKFEAEHFISINEPAITLANKGTVDELRTQLDKIIRGGKQVG